MVREMSEKIAKCIHEEYRKDRKGKKSPDDPAMQPWDKLREDFKESNRQQAEKIPELLKSVGYGIRALSGGKPSQRTLTPEDIEKMSILEHERFVSERKETGWVYGPIRDNEKKIHPCLCPWDVLPEEEREKDRQTVRRFPEYLAMAGMEIYPLKGD